MEGWIKLHRKFLSWEWYNDNNAKIVFIHLLLVANHTDQKWKGITIKRGQKLTSLGHLAKEVNLTVQQTRTAINKLKSTGEITIKTTNKNTLITIVNYDFYQIEKVIITDNKTNNITIKQQINNKQITTNKNDNNIKNNIYSQKQEFLTDTNITSQEDEVAKKKKEQELIEHFNLTWKIYPNKKGRAKAEEYFLQWIKGRKINKVIVKLTDKQMYLAVLKYAKECEENGTEQQYIKHGDTFFNKAILDYVEEKDE